MPIKWRGGCSTLQRHKELDLTGKVVIITGASRGIGKQAAQAFARRGANLVLAARTSVEPERRGGGRILNVTTGSGEVFRLPEEPPPKLERVGEFSLAVPGYYASKRALDRLGNVLAPELAHQGIAVIGLVATEIVALRVEEDGLDDSVAVPMEVPARMLVYFASCADPMEYTGRLFWAERELKELGLDSGDRPTVTA
jgi:NAD(P)-dependent dehydrogenase (short-subunit alcohol dehydrogenase family)